MAGKNDVVRFLVDKKANVNIANKFGTTPLHIITSQSGLRRYSLIEMLLKAGANVNALDQNLMSPLHIAASVDRGLIS